MITLQEWYNFNCKDNSIFVEHQSVRINMYQDQHAMVTMFSANMTLDDAVEFFGKYGVVKIRLSSSEGINPTLVVTMCKENTDVKDV